MENSVYKPTWADTEPVLSSIFDIFLSFLSDTSSSPESTAELLTSLFEESLRTREDSRKVKYLYIAILWIAKLIQHDDPSQDRLLAVLNKIQATPPVLGDWATDSTVQNLHEEWWRDLLYIDPALLAFEHAAPLIPPIEERRRRWGHFLPFTPVPWAEKMSGPEWVNMNAFVARIFMSTPDAPFGLPANGIGAFVDALEEECTAERLDLLVPVAACWIFYAGDVLWNKSNDPSGEADWLDDYHSDLRGFGSCGVLYRGRVGFNQERWGFWMTRFRELMVDKSLKLETRAFAERAWLEM